MQLDFTDGLQVLCQRATWVLKFMSDGACMDSRLFKRPLQKTASAPHAGSVWEFCETAPGNLAR